MIYYKSDMKDGASLTGLEVQQIFKSKERVAAIAKQYNTSNAVVIRIKLRTDARYYDCCKHLEAAPLRPRDRDGRLPNYTPTRRPE